MKLLVCLWCALAGHASAAASPEFIVIAADTTVDSLIAVPKGAGLMVKPGVTVAFAGYGRIEVRGLIVAQGTYLRPILFTTVGRPRGSTARPTWKGLEMAGKDAVGRFRHCRFEGAYRNLFWDCSPSFDSCEFAGNHYALYCAKNAAPPVKNCRFYHNGCGIVADHAAPLLLDNIVTGNAIGVHLLLSSRSVIGRNIIQGNDTDIKNEQVFGENTGSMSLHVLWNLVGQLY